MADCASPLRPTAWPPALFAAFYIAAAGVVASVTGNGEFLFYVAVMVLLLAAVAAIHLRVDFTTPLLWLLAIWGALHMAGGLVPVPESWPIQGDIRVLYSWWIVPKMGGGGDGGWLKYDHVVHAYGFGVTTWACWQAMRSAMADAGGKRRSGSLGLVILCGAAAMGFGALNEVVEFAATLLGPTNVGGYVNTGLDLIANSIGATIAATLIFAFQTRRS